MRKRLYIRIRPLPQQTNIVKSSASRIYKIVHARITWGHWASRESPLAMKLAVDKSLSRDLVMSRGFARDSASISININITIDHNHRPQPSTTTIDHPLDNDNGSTTGSNYNGSKNDWVVRLVFFFSLFSYLTNNCLQVDYAYDTGSATTTITLL